GGGGIRVWVGGGISGGGSPDLPGGGGVREGDRQRRGRGRGGGAPGRAEPHHPGRHDAADGRLHDAHPAAGPPGDAGHPGHRADGAGRAPVSHAQRRGGRGGAPHQAVLAGAAHTDRAPRARGGSSMSQPTKRRLGEILVERGFVTPDQLREALRSQYKEGKRLGEILIEMGALTADELNWALSELLGIPYVEFRDEMVDLDLARG